jgi:hypothetical protein
VLRGLDGSNPVRLLGHTSPIIGFAAHPITRGRLRPESGTAASGSQLHALNTVRSPITPDLPSQVFGLPLCAQQAILQGYNVTHRWA